MIARAVIRERRDGTFHDALQRHDAAPDAMRQDAATVRDYLGIKDGEAIPTKAHEKVARSIVILPGA